MKNNKLFIKIYLSLLIVFIITLVILAVLGNKARIGYLGNLKFLVNYTLEFNGLSNINDNFIIDESLDEEIIKNYIFTNEAITNYSYGFRINYYNKVFRNSDIYDVYLDTNKILQDNNFIKKIEMNKRGSPFGKIITSKIIDSEKIDNVYYTLKIKTSLFSIALLILLILIFIYIKYFAHTDYSRILRVIIYSASFMYIFLLYLVLKLELLYIIYALILFLEFIFILEIKNINYSFFTKKIIFLVSFFSLLSIIYINFFNTSILIKYIVLMLCINIFILSTGIYILNKFNLKKYSFLVIFQFLFNITSAYNYFTSLGNYNKFILFFIISSIVSILLFIFYIYSEYKKLSIEKIFFISFILIGLLYILFIPFSQSPDEIAHFVRANEISYGYFITDIEENKSNEYPREFLDEIDTYKELLSKITKYDSHNKSYNPSKFSSASVYMFISYIPQAIGIFIGNILNNNFLISIYIGRIFNLLFYAICLYLSIKYIPIKKYHYFSFHLCQ